MPLKRLVELHERIADRIEPEHHLRKGVRWFLNLSPSGEFLGFTSTVGDDKKPLQLVVPHRERNAPATPILLADRADYVTGLGFGRREGECADNHASFVKLVAHCADRCPHPALEVVRGFLTEKVDTARERVPADMQSDDVVTFRVGEDIVAQLPAVREYWQDFMTTAASERDTFRGECLVCGNTRPIAQRHPVKLKLGRDRVQLISADKEAFASYDLEASEVAPVCLPCALRYGQAANYLMTTPEHRYFAGGVYYLFWTRSGGTGGLLSLLQEPQPEEVRELLRTPFKTGQPREVDEEAFYALAATTNMSRLIVRDWLDTTVGEVKRNLARYFALQQIVRRDGEPYEPVALYRLARCLVRQMDDLSPQVIPALLGTALHGRPLPPWLLHQAVRRAHVDPKRWTYERAMLIKMVLNSQPESERRYPIVKEQLDLQNHHPAYLCGRLMRLLEEAQEAAIPGIGATIMDRFFATASTAPASVFGRLMRGSQNHLSKLRRDRPGTYHALQDRIMEVLGQLPSFPTVLDLTAQGLFILGYYHQRAADRAAAAEASARKKAAEEGTSHAEQ